MHNTQTVTMAIMTIMATLRMSQISWSDISRTFIAARTAANSSPSSLVYKDYLVGKLTIPDVLMSAVLIDVLMSTVLIDVLMSDIGV